MIPLVDLKAQYASIQDEVRDAIDQVLNDCAFIGGPHVQSFEKQFAEVFGGGYCAGVANGTVAIEVALRVMGLQAGDEVIVPANTFFASSEAVVRAGGVPRFADVCPDTLLITPEQAESARSPKTKALLAVHLFGQACDLKALQAWCDEHQLVLINDAAQAHLACSHGQPLSKYGKASTYSFYPGKNLGAYGDAGAVLSSDESFADRVRQWVNHGRQDKYLHQLEGSNFRIDALQCAVLKAKLNHLENWTKARQVAADRYDQRLQDLSGIQGLDRLASSSHVYHLYVIRVPRRDDLMDKMKAAGVGVGVHYPVPLHLQPAHAHLGYTKGDFPVSEAASQDILSLPLYPEITSDQQEQVVAALQKALD